jgi:hypothetical protein
MSTPSANRPRRTRVENQFGYPRSLLDGPEPYITLNDPDMPEGLLLLGLGPDPGIIAQTVTPVPRAPVSWLDAPGFTSQMPHSWHAAIPKAWTAISEEQFDQAHAANRKIVFYQPNLRLFPDFWTPILARMNTFFQTGPARREPTTVWMPASRNQLLCKELSRAFERLGLDVRLLSKALTPEGLGRMLDQEQPGLFFSVNFQGFDAYGYHFQLLRAHNVSVATWFVDNPFHLLSRIKSTFWRDCMLFVTDDWFIQPLRDHGATRVHHLPLAADPLAVEGLATAVLARKMGIADLPGQAPEHKLEPGSTVFVGHSSFPDKNSFFAGCAMEPEMERRAAAALRKGGRPDFAWWWENLDTPRLWPGKTVRQVGYGAEHCNQHYRAVHLNAAAQFARLVVFGDKGWADLLLDSAQLRPEVDYYGPLYTIYAQAGCCLNLTSLLLPHGLTQRHFDTWVAGGVLLTDFTPGLRIFPQDLVREIVFSSPISLCAQLRRLATEPNLGSQLHRAWSRHIMDHHIYDNRLAQVVNIMEMHPASSTQEKATP